MNIKISAKPLFGAALAVALALSAAQPVLAAPVLSNTAVVKNAAADHVTDVRWRAGPAFAAGAIAGLALGAAAASANSYYYAPAYGYDPYYSPAPVYSPYYAPYYGPVYDSRGYYRGRVDTNAGGNW